MIRSNNLTPETERGAAVMVGIFLFFLVLWIGERIFLPHKPSKLNWRFYLALLLLVAVSLYRAQFSH